jgi:hypothetical protein
MTAHGYQPRTVTPAGDAKGGKTPCSGERRCAKPTHASLYAQQKTHSSQQLSKRRVRGAGKSRRSLSPMVSRGVERSIKRRVERVERRSVHQRDGEQVGEVGEGRGQVSAEKITLCTTTHACVQPHVSLAGKRWARRGGMPMVQDTQGKRWKRPQVSRIPARPARVLWQEALLTGVCCVLARGGVMCGVRHK